MDEVYANIRSILGKAIGLRIIDITQHDKTEFEEDGLSYVMLMFENGCYMKFYVEDAGFMHDFEEDPV